MATQPVYSQVFRCPNPRSSIGLEVREVCGNATVQADIEHRSRGEKTWACAGSLGPIHAAGLTIASFDGLKEEVRVAFTTGGDGHGGPYVTVKILPPVADDD